MTVKKSMAQSSLRPTACDMDTLRTSTEELKIVLYEMCTGNHVNNKSPANFLLMDYNSLQIMHSTRATQMISVFRFSCSQK